MCYWLRSLPGESPKVETKDWDALRCLFHLILV